MKLAKEKRIVMAKEVARKWLRKRAKVECRFTVYSTGKVRNLPNLLKSFRDAKVTIKDVPKIPDLGIKEKFDAVELWSSDRVSLLKLKDWLEKRGLETSGIW